VLIEYWVVATRPKAVNGLGLSVPEANADVEDFLAAFPCLPEPPDIADRWRNLVNQHGVAGRPAHDTRLVALMEAHAVRELLTLNTSDFARYSQIATIAPSAYVAGQ
jgi:hypothetical protein